MSSLPPLTLGFVHLPAVAMPAGGSMLSAPLGATVSHRLPISTLRRLFALALYGVAAKMAAITL